MAIRDSARFAQPHIIIIITRQQKGVRARVHVDLRDFRECGRKKRGQKYTNLYTRIKNDRPVSKRTNHKRNEYAYITHIYASLDAVFGCCRLPSVARHCAI